MIFPCSWHSALSGFDTRYSMYCEDVDICFRALRAGGMIDVLEGFTMRWEDRVEEIFLFSYAFEKYPQAFHTI